ncbi:MAG: hypothetical protein ACTSRZ_01115 [Promethearchaeota archaeon]
MDPNEFIKEYWPVMMIVLISYFLVCGVLVILYAFKSKNQIEKKGKKKYFVNELVIGVLLIFNAVIYPWLFLPIVPAPDKIHQIMTFIGLEAVINLIVWLILIPIWKLENIIFWKYILKRPQRTYESWKEKIRKNWKDTRLRDFARKLMHFAFLIIVIYMWNRFKNNPLPGGWTEGASAVYYTSNIFYGFTIVMVLFDLLRLSYWKIFGWFPRLWAELTIKPSELDTFNSSSPMLLTMFPFILFGPSVFFSIVIIAPISDAMASIIGKAFGKKKPGKDKTTAGYIAGAVTTFLLVFVANFLFPFEGIAGWELVCIAIAGAIGFLLVDIFIKTVYDNFAIPIVCGLFIGVLYQIFLFI